MGGDKRSGQREVTLYVSDLDGTLLDPSSQVSDRSRELLNRAIGGGALFTVATARTPATVSGLLRGVDMRMPAVVMTGAALWNPSDACYSRVRAIPPATVRKMKEIYRRYGVPTFVYALRDGIIDMSHYGAMNAQEREFLDARIDSPFKRFGAEECDPDGMPSGCGNIALFYAMQPDEMVARVYEEVRRLDVTLHSYHDIFGPETAILEVFGPGVSKASAVRDLARSVGASRIVAFGDNVNDLPLLREADVSVAVGNALDEVKEAADVVIGTNAEDAVARFILDDMERGCNASRT